MIKIEWKIPKNDQNWMKNVKKKWSKLNEKSQKMLKTERKILKIDQNWMKNPKQIQNWMKNT